jgi:hypothetical protein
MDHHKTLFYALLLVGLCTGCSTQGVLSAPLTEGKQYPSVSPDKIAVFVTERAPFAYEVIAHVSAMADAGQNPRVPVEIIKEQAAKIGADAIVNLRINYGSGFFSNGIKATGMAVKFTE